MGHTFPVARIRAWNRRRPGGCGTAMERSPAPVRAGGRWVQIPSLAPAASIEAFGLEVRSLSRVESPV